MKDDARALGAWGESKAAAYLRRRGYKIVARNYRCRSGELDIVARKRDILAFVEVKLRKNDDFGSAREYVTAQKQQRVLGAAKHYLARSDETLQPRFDVVEVYAPNGRKTLFPQIVHLEDAFA